MEWFIPTTWSISSRQSLGKQALKPSFDQIGLAKRYLEFSLKAKAKAYGVNNGQIYQDFYTFRKCNWSAS